MYFLFYINCFVTNIKSVFLHQLWNNQCKIITLSVINFSSTIINPHPHQNHTLIHLSPIQITLLKLMKEKWKETKQPHNVKKNQKEQNNHPPQQVSLDELQQIQEKKIKRKVDPTHWSNITAPLPTKYIGWTYFNNRLEI